MLRAAVPKTAIHKYSQSFPSKSEVGSAGQVLVSAPAGYLTSAENGSELELGILIAARTNRSHDLRAFSFCEYVCHSEEVSESDPECHEPV